MLSMSSQVLHIMMCLGCVDVYLHFIILLDWLKWEMAVATVDNLSNIAFCSQYPPAQARASSTHVRDGAIVQVPKRKTTSIRDI
jgi:hypothetical protein